MSDKKHLLEAHPDGIYPANWSQDDKPGSRAGYVSLEKSQVYANTAQGAFDLAGLGKVVKVSNRTCITPLTPVCHWQLDSQSPFTA